MRIAFAILVLAAARPMLGCEAKTVVVPQEIVREAAIVAEGVAAPDLATFELTKVWKGKAEKQLRLTGLAAGGPGSCDDPPPIAGERYLIFVNPDGAPRALRVESVSSVLAYLANPVTVSRRHLVTMLRQWHEGKVSNASLARWLREVTPVADVGEASPVLNVMRDLNSRINERGVPLEELSCELGVLRTRVAPTLIAVLSASKVTEEELEHLEDPDETIERLCPQPGS